MDQKDADDDGRSEPGATKKGKKGTRSEDDAGTVQEGGGKSEAGQNESEDGPGSRDDASTPSRGSGSDASSVENPDYEAADAADYVLLGAPMLFSPTPDGFGISLVLEMGDPAPLRVQVRQEGERVWGKPREGEVRGVDVIQWTVTGLNPGTRYEYRVVLGAPGSEVSLYRGSVVTARPEGEAFSFALITDTHIGAYPTYGNQGDPTVLRNVAEQVAVAKPDFIANLGDMLDFHQFGFNDPPPDGSVTRLAYLQYRGLLGDAIGHAPHFGVIGNWEGENGNYPKDAIAWSREQRMLYLPNPNPGTYPEGGSPAQDYYAFRWGDALFVVLNVMTYTPTEHLLSTAGGTPEDWTLGETQLNWLEQTLKNATSKWRFLMIHHAVGGAAGDLANAAYGRGGGQAANVGEQAIVHDLMKKHGVQIFFYGHDHVFTDMVVDGIHYSMPGSAGAIWMFTQAETGYEQSWLESGWGRVEVAPEAVEVEFLNLQGTRIHGYTLE